MPVYREESAYISSTNTLPHHHGHIYSSQFGYTPGCCDDTSYTNGLWAGYCETRHSHWMHGSWYFSRILGGDCCDSCDAGGKSCEKQSCK